MSGYTYTRETVEWLLDCVWDPDWAILRSKEEQVGSGGGPSDGMDVVCLAADVRKAWARLTDFDRDLLAAKYHHGLTLDAIAHLAGFPDVQKAADELEGAIGALIDLTNGARK